MKIPESKEELDEEITLDTHERYLRTLILNGHTPIYIGDTVKVSDRWAGDSRNPDEGKVGKVIGIECGMQGAFNIDYLVYTARNAGGSGFEVYYYTLDRVHQPMSNQLLEKMLRETNAEFATRYKTAR